MSDVLLDWEQWVKLKTVTTVKVEFVKTDTVVVDSVLCVVQPAQKEVLKNDSLDWSKEHILIHRRGGGIDIGQYIEWDGRDFKVVGPNGNYKNYGFQELVGEETKKTLLVAT